jgi:hypothetical protein
VAVKPAPYLPVYEELLLPLREQPFSMLELGVWKGDSLAMWRDGFPHATIVGVDAAQVPLQLGPRVHVIQGDQGDRELLGRLRSELAPAGFDVVIDDCSHIGALTAASLQALFIEHVKPGGLYIIEDWGTGYVPSWPDGRAPDAMVGVEYLAESSDGGDAADGGNHRMPSHDAGMVGLVKRLVDHTAAGTLGVHQPDWISQPLPIEWMRVHDGLVILKKAG